MNFTPAAAFLVVIGFGCVPDDASARSGGISQRALAPRSLAPAAATQCFGVRCGLGGPLPPVATAPLDLARDYPVPSAGVEHAVIRVRASSFNYHDVFTMRGMPGIKLPLPVIVGLDMAGEIVEIGPDVSGWKIGDRVLVNPLNKKK